MQLPLRLGHGLGGLRFDLVPNVNASMMRYEVDMPPKDVGGFA